MPKTLQIRDISDDVYAALKRRAAEDGITVPELLRREATRLASRPSMKQWYAEIQSRRHRSSTTVAQTLEALDDLRGPWPDARP